MRKRMGALLAACLLAVSGAAGAQGLCEPSQVDVSGVQEIDGRLVGEIVLPQGVSGGVLKIDCPMPAAFTDEQQATLSVDYRAIGRDELVRALQSVGQSVDASQAEDFASDDGMTVTCWLEVEQGLKPYAEMGARSMLRKDVSARADAAALTQAGELLCDAVRALGAAPCEGMLDVCANSPDDLYPYPLSASDDADYARKTQLREWRKSAEHYGRDPNEKLVFARVCYELYGLPVAGTVMWQEGEYLYSAPALADCAVREDGTLASFEAANVPSVTSVTPMTLPALDWRTWLQGWVGRCYEPTAHADLPYEDLGFGAGVTYAAYDVLTSIQPCWAGAQKHRLEAGWLVEIENRVVKDDSLIAVLDNANVLSAFVEGVEIK